MAGASAWSATADTALVLILARGAAGIGAAFVFPSTLSTLTAISTGERKGRAVTDPPDVSPADTTLGRPCGRHDLRERTRIPHSEVSEHLAINLDVR